MADLVLLTRRLLEIEEPLFAVLDGAQFDDLPSALFDGDFVHRPLYLNDTIGDKDRVRTVPQLVWLDRDRAALPEMSRADQHDKVDPAILRRLLELVNARPAVVFWLFPPGGEALFRHLRTINLVRLPRDSLPLDEQKFTTQATVPFLFRHADANVMAQVLSGLNAAEVSRLFGPAGSILFAPDDHWSPSGAAIEANRPTNPPPVRAGMLELSSETMRRIARARADGLRAWAISEFGSGGQRTAQVADAFARAISYEFEQKDEIWEFIRLDLAHGARFEDKQRYQDAKYYLSVSTKSPKERIYYASEHCDRVVGE